MAFDNSPLGRGETAVAVSPLLVRKTIDEVADFGDDKLANEAAAIDAKMEQVVEAAGPDFDLTKDEVGKIDGFSGNAADRATRFVELHSRGAGIQNVMAKRHAAAEAQAEFLQLREDALKANLGDISGAAQPTSRTNPAFLSTDVLSQICDKYGLKATNDVLKQAVNIAGETGFTISSEVDVNRYLNATVTTDAGYDPFVTRQPGITRFISRPLQVIDTMPRASTMQHSIKFMIQVVRAAPTDAQMAVAEGAASTEASMQWWEYDEPMRELAAHIPVTEVQMEDVAQIRAIIDEDLRLMVLQSLDGELLIGPGTSNRIRGIATSRTINGTATSPLKFTWSKNNNTAAGRRNDQLKDMKRAKTRLKITGARHAERGLHARRDLGRDIASGNHGGGLLSRLSGQRLPADDLVSARCPHRPPERQHQRQRNGNQRDHGRHDVSAPLDAPDDPLGDRADQRPVHRAHVDNSRRSEVLRAGAQAAGGDDVLECLIGGSAGDRHTLSREAKGAAADTGGGDGAGFVS